MESIKSFIIVLGMAMIFILSACSNKLDVQPQWQINDQQISDLLAEGDPATQELILGGLANNLPLMFNLQGIHNMGTADISYYTAAGLGVMRDLEGNDMILGNQPIGDNLAGAIEYNLGNIQGQADERTNASYWYYSWQLITASNQLLDLMTDEIVQSSNLMKEYKARALTVRAYAYNYLMENYVDAYMQGGSGKPGVPIYTTFDPTQPFQPRASSQDVYNFIKKDIEDAVSLLQAAGVGYTPATDDIDLGVANFVRARVALVTGDYPTVLTATNDILSHYSSFISQANYGAHKSGSDYLAIDNAFMNNSVNPEVILGFSSGVATTYFNNLMNIFGEGYGGLNQAYKRVDERLYNKIPSEDFRKDAFQGSVAFGDHTYPTQGTVRTLPNYINFKFAATHGIDGVDIHMNTTDISYMRLSEVLLMKAEAQASGPTPNDAIPTLNQLLAARTRTGETSLTTSNYPAMAGMTPLQMVQFQTRVEMWGEGKEFFNNRRWGIAVDRSSSSNHISKGSLSVPQMTIDIPSDETNHNPQL